MRLRVGSHCILRSLIGQRGRDYLSSLRTRRGRLEDSKKLSWMRILHGSVHGKLHIMFHGLLEFASGPPPRGRPNANFDKPCQLNNWSGLWMRVDGSHNYTVMVLGSCVKWPLRPGSYRRSDKAWTMTPWPILRSPKVFFTSSGRCVCHWIHQMRLKLPATLRNHNWTSRSLLHWRNLEPPPQAKPKTSSLSAEMSTLVSDMAGWQSGQTQGLNNALDYAIILANDLWQCFV